MRQSYHKNSGERVAVAQTLAFQRVCGFSPEFTDKPQSLQKRETLRYPAPYLYLRKTRAKTITSAAGVVGYPENPSTPTHRFVPFQSTSTTA